MRRLGKCLHQVFASLVNQHKYQAAHWRAPRKAERPFSDALRRRVLETVPILSSVVYCCDNRCRKFCDRGGLLQRSTFNIPSYSLSISLSCDLQTLVKPPGSSESISVDPGDQPLPLLQVFTYPVIIAISNYMSLAFLSACSGSLFPLVAAMPIDIGGLDLDPPRIGYILGFFNAITGVFSFLFFPTLTHRFGVRTIFVASMSSFPVFWVLFWAVSLSAKYYGVGKTVYMWIGAMLIPYIFIDLAYGG